MDEFFMLGVDCLILLLYRIWKLCRPRIRIRRVEKHYPVNKDLAQRVFHTLLNNWRIHFLVANLVVYGMNQMVT